MENEEDIKKNYKVTNKDNFLDRKELRVFDKKENKWVENFMLTKTGDKIYINNEFLDIKEGEENRFIICQYTGYTRNDIKLFENDYVGCDFAPAVYKIRMKPNCLWFEEVKCSDRWGKMKREVKNFPYLLNHNIVNIIPLGNIFDTNLDDIEIIQKHPGGVVLFKVYGELINK